MGRYSIFQNRYVVSFLQIDCHNDFATNLLSTRKECKTVSKRYEVWDDEVN
jgi:hypothetical protein